MLLVFNSIFSFLLLFSQFACENSTPDNQNIPVSQSGYNFPYQVNSPDKSIELDSTLNEISGLSMMDKRILANNDETGFIFMLDASNGEIREGVPFHKDADYEGIEFAKNNVYVIRSSGTIYEVKHPFTEGQEMAKFNTFLDKSYDVEGFGYDAGNELLLIGCKGTGPDTAAFLNTKPVYGFDLQTMKLREDPLFLIKKEDLFTYIQAHPNMDDYDELIEEYAPDTERLAFGPSGIAQHPYSGNYYVLSSVGRLLAVYDQNGQLLHLQKLRKKLHAQPEGICFDTAGTLFISSEAKGKRGPVLHKFYLKS